MNPRIKRLAAATFRGAQASGVMSALERFGDSQEGLLRILCYHRIAERDEPEDLYPGTVSATPDEFDRQLDALARRYRVVSLHDVLASVREARPLPRRAVLITFDDGYDDFASTAWPALKRYGLVASLFVPTAYPGRGTHDLWWDQLYRAMLVGNRRQVRVGSLGPQSLLGREQRLATFCLARDLVKRLPHQQAMSLVRGILEELDVAPVSNRLLDWSALRRLAGEGVEIGSHTRSHALLNRLDRAAVVEEIGGAFADLKRELGASLPVLAYPAGGCGADLAEIAKEQGVEIGLTTRRGVNRAGRDSPLLLRRVLVGPLTTPSLLRAELLPWSGAVSRWRRSAAQATTYGT